MRLFKTQREYLEKMIGGDTYIVEIDTSSATSPVTLITPSTGKRIEVRSLYIATDSNSGRIAVEFPTSGKLVGVLYASTEGSMSVDGIAVSGAVEEALKVEWSSLTTDAKIFVLLRYAEI